MSYKSFFILVLIIFGGIFMFSFFKKGQSSGTSDQDQKQPNMAMDDTTVQSSGTQPSSTAPASTFVAQKYTVTLKTTQGDIVLELNGDQTPKTVENFVTLANKGFYNNTIFHRVINGFMIQGGDPKGDGTGGPGYKFDDEPFTGEYLRGTIAMANAGPNTNGSQFFIMHQDYPLPKNYVIFGRVTKGIEVVDAIATAPTTMSSSGEKSKPVQAVTVRSVVVAQ